MNRYCGGWWGAVAALFATGAGLLVAGVWIERRARRLYEAVNH